MSFLIGQDVEYGNKRAKVVGVISAFMEPGKMPEGITDISQEYLDKGIDCSRCPFDSILLEGEFVLVRVPMTKVKNIPKENNKFEKEKK